MNPTDSLLLKLTFGRVRELRLIKNYIHVFPAEFVRKSLKICYNLALDKIGKNVYNRKCIDIYIL